MEHCVTVNPKKERMSIAFFFNPNFQAEVGPADGLINPNNPPRFGRVGMEKYVNDYFSRRLEGKSYLEYMKINPDEETHNVGKLTI